MSYYKQYKKIKDMIVSDRDEWKELGYERIEEELIERTISFVDEIIDSGLQIGCPEILPCPDGTINLNWEKPGFNILINIPIKKEDETDYYFKNLIDEKQSAHGKNSLKIIKDLIIIWMSFTQ